MFLTRIELLGFKSFADKTVCTLGEGLTAVVGPNGCGKSNIVEAIRWVLGEQRPSMMRGRAMGDVIFSGSSSTGPVSMAQVTLVFDNSRGTLPFEAPEIEVSRRLYKDGESKYLLNMRPCMLREIKDTFYNSGLGAPEYAIMQREMIDMLLANRASERRVLIEEAAGTLRYRAHIKQSLSRLHNAESSIVRLTDITQERDRVVRRLKAEAAQARRAKRYRERMVELRRMIAAAAVRSLQTDEEPLREALARSRRALEGFQAEQAGLEAQVEAERLQIGEFDQRISDTISEQGRVRDELASASAAVALLDARAADTTGEQERIRREIIDAVARRDSASGLMEKGERVAATLDQELETLRGATADHEAQRVASESRIRQIREDAMAAQVALAEAERAVQSAVHDREKCEMQLRHAQETAAARAQESAALAGQTDDAAQRVASLSETLADLTRRLASCDQAVAHAILQCDKASRLTVRSEETARTAELAYREATTRRDVMRSTLDAHEGFSDGARFLMARSPHGILGLLGEEISPRDGCERAVDAALAEAVDFVVVEHRDTARHLLDMLRDPRAGRARVVERPLAGSRNDMPAPVAQPGDWIIGPLLDTVEAPSSLMPVVRSLLGRALLLRSLPADEHVQALWEHGWEQLVTIEGDVLRADGIHQGGSGSQTTVLGRRRNLDMVEKSLARRSQRQRLWSQRAVRLRERWKLLEGTRDEALARRQGLSVEKAGIAGELQAAEETHRRVTAALAGMAEEATRGETAIRSCHEALESAARHVGQGSSRLAEAREHHGQVVREMREAEAEQQAESAALEPLRQRLIRLEEELATVHAGNGRHRLQLEAEQRLIPGLERRLEALAEAAERAAAERGDRQKRVGVAQERLGEIDRGVAAMRTERMHLVERLGSLESAVGDARERTRREREAAHEAELELAKREARLQEVIAHASQDLDIAHGDLVGIEPTAPLPDLEQELEQIRSRSAALGDVNVRADEQFVAESAELERLQRELTDVRESRDELLRSIDRANRTARERFTATFDRVSEYFTQTFSALLPGGQARLELPGEGSILTREIEIVAQPPGKRSRPVELLSGGERALTALSFLFGVYREKAGPLCVLDEVDAPLDDANTSRFMDMLERLSSTTQFIVVTHNKHTMSRAARLLGVTMESGVSRLVPVELRRQGA
ncbi:MAG: chromosome segregation protein SMC [Candidatus Eisenbacteria bacterium]|nr:chromosome segregation protein SMC [Candidatus Eisenbacteria bacterium]